MWIFIVLGCVVVIALILGVLFLRERRKRNDEQKTTPFQNSADDDPNTHHFYEVAENPTYSEPDQAPYDGGTYDTVQTMQQTNSSSGSDYLLPSSNGAQKPDNGGVYSVPPGSRASGPTYDTASSQATAYSATDGTEVSYDTARGVSNPSYEDLEC